MKRKFDADALLSQVLIWLLLIGYVALVYILTLFVTARPSDRSVINFSPAWWQNLVAFLVIILTFLPVYRWVRVRVRALVYGQHENPFPVFVQFQQQFESTPSPHNFLPAFAETIAQTLKLPFVEIKTLLPDTQGTGVPLVATVGRPPKNAAIEQVPLTYQGLAIGELRVAARGWDEPLSRSDLLVLSNLARQVEIALYAAQLTRNLQHARERLVIAREEERRRIRNDLHDGLAPTLSSLQLQLGALRGLIPRDPDHASVMIDEMREDLRDATGEIRRLIYDLRPPMLDELGMVGAIKNHGLPETGVHFDFIAPDPMPLLPAALEVAVYRVAREAINNVIRHAQATECVVRIEIGREYLTLSVTDNGKGIPHPHQVGVGLQSMRERVTELGGTQTVQSFNGGGTCLTAQFPLDRKD